MRSAPSRTNGTDAGEFAASGGAQGYLGSHGQGKAHTDCTPSELVKATLDAWLTAAGIEAGPLFRSLCRAGKAWGHGISENTVWQVVKKTAAAETGARAGELIALRASDVNLEHLYVEISKALWSGTEDTPKTEAGNRIICISARLGAALRAYLNGREEGHLFQTDEGGPWDASNILVRKLNKLLTQLEIPKIDPKILAKVVGKDRTIAQAARSEKRAASLGLHSFRHYAEFRTMPSAAARSASRACLQISDSA